MYDKVYQQLKELSWRRRLSPGEQELLHSCLTTHPKAQQDWEQDRRLSQWLSELPNVPVSSNFTARVMQAARRAPAEKARWYRRMRLPAWFAAGWIPRYATGALLVGLALFSIHQHSQVVQKKMAYDLVKVSQVATLPEIEWMKDFETIDRLTRVQVADSELLTALR